MAREASGRHWFFESLQRVSSALRADHDYDVLLSDTLEVTLSVLDCDRAWLAYPCDADADVQRVVVERTRAGWERSPENEAGVPVSKEIAALLRKLLASDAPVCTGEGADAKVPDSAARLGVRASMVQAVRPKMEQPYVFGVHRCAEARGWNDDERRLFEEIGRRLGDALTACLVIERLRENERRLEAELAERQATEKRLHANEALYRAVVDHATDALFLHGEGGQILDVNQGACDSLGYTREELLGMSPYDFDPDVTPDGAREMVERLETGEIVAFDTHHRKKDGTTFPVEVRIRRFSDGTRHLSVALARDISARKQSEERIRTSEERFRELAENIDDVSWVTDASKTEMLYVSPAYEKIWGRSCQSLYASPQSWLDPIHPDDRERVLAAAMTKQAESAYDEENRSRGAPAYLRAVLHDEGTRARNGPRARDGIRDRQPAPRLDRRGELTWWRNDVRDLPPAS